MILGFLGPPSASGHGLCGFNKGQSLVVKSRVKSLTTAAMSELDHEKVKISFSGLVSVDQDSPNF